MRLSTPLKFAASFASFLSSALAGAAKPATTTTLTLTLPSHQNFQPWTLPPSTHATLSSLGSFLSAPITVANTFVFRNVTAGSYLADVHCATHAFMPLRIDVMKGEGEGEAMSLAAWETYRGNDWDNKGEAVPLRESGKDMSFELRLLGGKNYFVERMKFNALNILKNPTILLALVSLGIFIGMPYLVDNMDPEMRAEFEERQKSSPMNSILGGQQSGNPLDFDMAGFLAGSSKDGGKKKK